ncbi:hypothetical protein F4821DRAFT_208717 [Hypoxylon rubiginosum]|uniref:Uncharacterized protein n=1 Tax=Hypoxylon rubiginosum TaxID=110542 RepID=A0ACC0CQB2_9PEZI|nr:hypothetical protein F4821DRAFT_208717 [Hypoxylon rubiginosum]
MGVPATNENAAVNYGQRDDRVAREISFAREINYGRGAGSGQGPRGRRQCYVPMSMWPVYLLFTLLYTIVLYLDQGLNVDWHLLVYPFSILVTAIFDFGLWGYFSHRGIYGGSPSSV